jgi:hypothetical protein
MHKNSLAAILLKTCDFFYQIFISPSQPGTLNALIKATLPFGLHASLIVTPLISLDHLAYMQPCQKDIHLRTQIQLFHLSYAPQLH